MQDWSDIIDDDDSEFDSFHGRIYRKSEQPSTIIYNPRLETSDCEKLCEGIDDETKAVPFYKDLARRYPYEKRIIDSIINDERHHRKLLEDIKENTFCGCKF